MKNRIYTMCNGNDIVNDLKEIPPNPKTGKTKFTGCNTCHPGNHVSDVGSTGTEAESAIDCLVCHSSEYDYRQRKPYKDEKGRVVMGQDRSVKAALAVGKPGVKNCMVCHEAAGGGVLVKRGFAFTPGAPTSTRPRGWSASTATGEGPQDPDRLRPEQLGQRRRAGRLRGLPRREAPQGRGLPTATRRGSPARRATSPGPAAPWRRTSRSGPRGPTGSTSPPRSAWRRTKRRRCTPGTTGPWPTPRHFIGPKGSRTDKESRIYPFKIYEGKAYFDRKTGQLLSMDFAPPMATGDTLAGVASAAKTLGIREYDPVPGWQTIYFGSSHLVTKEKALSCANCHAQNGVLNFRALGYSEEEIRKLTSAGIYFDKMAAKQKEEW